MCGIVGIISKNKADTSSLLLPALSALRHRGPDATGIFLEQAAERQWIGLGHNRLSILDLSSRGHQPMKSPDGRYILVYNGEVYNYLEIAQELGKDAVVDISPSDTAVVLSALIRWGALALQRFNGMWALAFYDREKGTLLLSRDRMGVKPLYYYVDQDKFIFASEIKAILYACGRRLKLNRKVAMRYLLQSILDAQPETFFEGVYQFPSAGFTTINLKQPVDHELTFRAFWRHPYEEDGQEGWNIPSTEELRETFIDSVRLRLRSDVPLGVLLSGGVDSSSILGAVATLRMIDNVNVLSVVSDDVKTSEEPFIDLMARYAGCRVVKLNADQDARNLIDELSETCWYNDEPLTGLAAVAHRNLMRIARDKGITVLITGQGSDEQLAGYNKFLYFYIRDCLRRGAWYEAFSIICGCAKERTIIPEFRWREAKRYLPRLAKFSGIQSLSASRNDMDMLDTGFGKSYQEREWRDIRFLSIPLLLHYEDRMSMSYSREMRVPFMDYRLVELLGRIPPSYKLRSGWTKAVFRKAMGGIVPERIRYRKDKKGFNIPLEQWMCGVLRKRFSDMFGNPMLAEVGGFLRRSVIREMYQRFLKGDFLVNYKEIFNVYCFEIWLRRFEQFVDN